MTTHRGCDAENRLVLAEPDKADGVFDDGDVRVSFAYDYLGRRVSKTVETWDDTTEDWENATTTYFVYDGWRVIEELDGSEDVLRQYAWGLDLSLTLEGAGGIGGLLAIKDVSDSQNTVQAVAMYDANGNLGQLVDWTAANVTAAMIAKYEYDPYGNIVGPNSDGDSNPAIVDAFDDDTYAGTHAIRFSTKWQDAETGLNYFTIRYYNARLGRWINRDPIDEAGGLNLHAFVRNRSLDTVDPLGLFGVGGWPVGIDWGAMQPPPRKPPLDFVPPLMPPGGLDHLFLWCYNTPSRGSGPGSHCTLICNDERIDGTGPGTPENLPGIPGQPVLRPNPGGGGNPGIGVSDPNLVLLPGGSRYQEGVPAKDGTCDCIKAKGAALNSIPGKNYGDHLNMFTSNSNSAIGCVLKACGVDNLRPGKGEGHGFDDPILYNCRRSKCSNIQFMDIECDEVDCSKL